METEKPSSKQALALAFAAKRKTQNKADGGEVTEGATATDRTCYACGGIMPESMSEGGIAGEALEEGELENAPDTEEPEAEDAGGGDRLGFLRAYLTNRRLRGQA